MGAWLSFSFFLFSGCSGLVFFTRGVFSWRRSRYDVLGLVFLEYADKAFAEVPDFIEYPTPVQVLIEFVFWALLMFAMAPGRWQWRSLRPLALSFSHAVHHMLSLSSLYSCSPWSSRPQPLGSGGDTTPCEDTRGDHELSFNFNHQVLLQCVVFKCRCEKCNRDPQ